MDQQNSPQHSPAGGKSDDLVYNVMPSDGKNFPGVESSPMGAPSGPMVRPNPTPDSGGSSKWTYFIVGIIVLLILGGAAYYLLGSKKTETPETSLTKVSKAFLTQYFNIESCSDEATCGDEADPDTDGLTNVGEFKATTNPLNPDTDSDGLADGDEFNIYKTDPTLKYTDRREIVATNNWTDGAQIKNGYDPNTGIKLTDIRKQQIAADTITFHLHEPSITTTTIAPTPTPTPTSTQTHQTVNVTIQNNAFTPASVSLKIGDTIVWTNKDTATHLVASDPHPTHTGLPGLESSSLQTNKTFSFTFTKAGTFGYHDHLNPSTKGTVIVK